MVKDYGMYEPLPEKVVGTYPGWWFAAMAEANRKALATQRRTKVHVVKWNDGGWGPHIEYTPVITLGGVT